MELCKNGTRLIVKNDKNDLEVKKYTKTGDTTFMYICQLKAFFKNNIGFELNKISILQLDNCGISEVPHDIRKLNLKQLTLTHNKLSEVPSCLYSALNNLELLDLSHNFIKNFDIEPACRCTIVVLKLNDNQIYNMPHWILTLKCPKLTELTYSNNYVTDLKTSRELNFNKLEMSNCQLFDVDLKFFKVIKTLEYLDVSNRQLNSKTENKFKDVDKLFIDVKWKNMKILILNNLGISVLPQGVFRITSLTELHLTNSDLSWIPESVQYLKNLEVLDVSNNTICSLPSQLFLLPNILVIKAPFNNISSVTNFTKNLQILDLYENCLETPFNCDKIKLIDLEQNLFDTTTLSEISRDYAERRDRLREIFNYDRLIGPKELPNEVLSCDWYCSTESEDCTEDIHLNIDETEFESWDDEKPKIFLQIHPEITTSDDEWDGSEDNRHNENKEKLKFLKHYIDIDEDWIFSDAEAV